MDSVASIQAVLEPLLPGLKGVKLLELSPERVRAEMLVRPDLSDGSALDADQVAVTIPVETDSVYAGLRPTDEVALLATVNAGEPDSTTTTLLDRAVVFDIALERGIVRSTSADGTEAEGEVTNVTLAIPRSEAERVANALVNAELTVVLLSRSVGP